MCGASKSCAIRQLHLQVDPICKIDKYLHKFIRSRGVETSCAVYWTMDSSKSRDDCYQVMVNIELDSSVDSSWSNRLEP